VAPANVIPAARSDLFTVTNVTQLREERPLIQKGIKLLLTPLAVALMVFAVAGAPVGAHQSEVSQGNDFAITASDHESGTVCDQERDGRAVSAEWRDAEGFVVGLEWDGGDAGCDEIQFHGGKAYTVVVCEVGPGGGACTDSHRV
jgi:hypothetical protein